MTICKMQKKKKSKEKNEKSGLFSGSGSQFKSHLLGQGFPDPQLLPPHPAHHVCHPHSPDLRAPDFWSLCVLPVKGEA